MADHVLDPLHRTAGNDQRLEAIHHRVVELVAVDQLYKLTTGNLIPHYKPQGKMLYFERAELEAWLRQNPIRTQAQTEAEAQKYVLARPARK